jgi:DNA polymerase
VTFGVSNGFLYCRLPSGRALAYKNPRLRRVMTPWGQEKFQLVFDGLDDKKRWVAEDTYGGKLVENIVQAVARDLMVEGMFRVEAAGYAILLTVHDEVISEIAEAAGDLSEYERLLAEEPDWAKGCPVKAKGWRGKRYRKG